MVALRKESVDRNTYFVWRLLKCCFVVALRKESVDRNTASLILRLSGALSLSARRAWIEIAPKQNPTQQREVALRKESVDRNGVIKGAC